MYTTSVLVTLHLFATSSALPTWNRDYPLAMKRAEAAQKPVAVFIGSGSWQAMCKDGEPGPRVCRLLADHYICVFVDASRQAEQPLARSFEAGEQPLLVLSSCNRLYQAYRHSGALARASLEQVLELYATEEIVAAAQAERAPCRT